MGAREDEKETAIRVIMQTPGRDKSQLDCERRVLNSVHLSSDVFLLFCSATMISGFLRESHEVIFTGGFSPRY